MTGAFNPVAQKEAAMFHQPQNLTERLNMERERLTTRLAKIEACLDMLSRNPELETALNLVSEVEMHPY